MFLKVQVIVTWCRPMPSHQFESFLRVVWVRSSGFTARTGLCPVPSNSVCTCSSFQDTCFCSEKRWAIFICRLTCLCQCLSWKAQRGLLVTNQLFLPTLRQRLTAFCCPVASLQSKRVSEAVLSLLLVGSRRGLVCLCRQVYIFVCGLCRASFYSVSPARCLLMHAFLSFAASKATDKTSSSLVSISGGLFETQTNSDALAVICLDRVTSASARLLFYTASPVIPVWSWNLCASLQVTHPDFVTFRRQAGTAPALKSPVFSFRVPVPYVTSKP